MSEGWMEITGEQIPDFCWVGGYDDDGQWHQTRVHQSPVDPRHVLGTTYSVRHRITHWAPFEAPEPPPKPVSLEEAASQAQVFLFRYWRLLPESRHQEAVAIAKRLSRARFQTDANVDH